MRIVVAGAGSWGTTLAIMLARRAGEVFLWEFRPDFVRQMIRERENREFLPGYPFPDNLTPIENLSAECVADLMVMAVPSHAMRRVAAIMPDGPGRNALVVSVVKGIEETTLLRMTEVLLDVWKERIAPGQVIALSGPSHAEEVIKGIPTSVVAASCDLTSAHKVQEVFSNERFRVYAHDDVVGVELGGALKNIIALAAGIADGLGFGDNTKGALMTRGLAEITRLGVKLGGRPATFAGLSGMGDLITTCTSRHSRNRFVGEALGRGRKLSEILAGMTMVAEGVRTTRSTYDLARREAVEMPIVEQVHRILFEDVDPLKATMELMSRRLKVED
ncbi:MAG: NAD(P)-dependent glycerol-3-phosphate dehydrogenase [Calditrichaeota bacterium]|nr:NAD(P)-dependent glycerol-3-phosphate dehydrogenase [Calditrichota bacterium]